MDRVENYSETGRLRCVVLHRPGCCKPIQDAVLLGLVYMTSWVNPKIIVKDAGKKGLGSFGKALISKGEVLVVQGGRIMTYKNIEESEYKYFDDYCFQVEKSLFICPIEPRKERLDGIFLVNHSCSPNSGFRGQVILVAMRDIHPGEEITYDYVMTDTNFDDVICLNMACFCGSNNCRHIITGEDWEQVNLQRDYKGYFSDYIQRMINRL